MNAFWNILTDIINSKLTIPQKKSNTNRQQIKTFLAIGFSSKAQKKLNILMQNNPINPFEYVSILISIILGLGITQLLASFSDLLYKIKKVKFYLPHTLWIVFVLFLHIQDWFITYQIKNKWVWSLPELFFVLLYPISLYMASKMLLPNNDQEEKQNMKIFYHSQFPIIFFIVGLCVLLSILFNLYFINETLFNQIPLLLLLSIILYLSIKKINNEIVHHILAIALVFFSIISTVIEKNVWVIK